MVSFGGKKFEYQTSMYESRGLPTKRAWVKDCQMEYTESTLRMR